MHSTIPLVLHIKGCKEPELLKMLLQNPATAARAWGFCSASRPIPVCVGRAVGAAGGSRGDTVGREVTAAGPLFLLARGQEPAGKHPRPFQGVPCPCSGQRPWQLRPPRTGDISSWGQRLPGEPLAPTQLWAEALQSVSVFHRSVFSH